MISCVAIDDEPLTLRQIVSYIKQTVFLELKEKFTSTSGVAQYLEENVVDLLFLDINMPGINGMELAKTLENPPKIIFTTAYSEYAVEGYKVNALDYLLKPIEYDDFLLAAKKAEENINQSKIEHTALKKKDDFLFIKSGQQYIRVNFNDIKYIEAQKEYVSLHLINADPVKTLLRLKNIEEVLPKQNFMRIHRSFIVNLNHIVTLERNRIIYSSKEFIVVSETYQEEFKKFINENFFN